MRLTFSIFIVAGLLVLLGIVGQMEHSDAEKEQNFYCQMVHEGHWPDYNNLNKQGKCNQPEQ